MGIIEDNRRQRLFSHVSLGGKILEVGPYDQPTVAKTEADVRYLDYQTREQLAAAVRDPEQVKKIPETDILVTSDEYDRLVGETFDLIIANHVFEHVPNPIRWLQMIHRMLNENGVLFMALPDKKYTFDKYRADTALSHLLHDYFSDVKEISSEHVLETAIYYDMDFIKQKMDVEERLNVERLRQAIAQGPHLGIHCHVFQSESFQDKLLKPILQMGLVSFTPIGFYGSAENYGEFMVVLRKQPPEISVTTAEFYTTDYARPESPPPPEPPPPEPPLEPPSLDLRAEAMAAARRFGGRWKRDLAAWLRQH